MENIDKMKITLNNKPEELHGFDTISVAELLKVKNFTYKLIIVRINDKGIVKEDYGSTLIKENDNVLVLHMITGG